MKKEPMIRKQLYIEPAQDAFIKELAAEYGMSEAQFIRSRFDLQAKNGNTGRWTRDEIYER